MFIFIYLSICLHVVFLVTRRTLASDNSCNGKTVRNRNDFRVLIVSILDEQIRTAELRVKLDLYTKKKEQSITERHRRLSNDRTYKRYRRMKDGEEKEKKEKRKHKRRATHSFFQYTVQL
jgi:hypothetical protein